MFSTSRTCANGQPKPQNDQTFSSYLLFPLWLLVTYCLYHTMFKGCIDSWLVYLRKFYNKLVAEVFTGQLLVPLFLWRLRNITYPTSKKSCNLIFSRGVRNIHKMTFFFTILYIFSTLIYKIVWESETASFVWPT